MRLFFEYVCDASFVSPGGTTVNSPGLTPWLFYTSSYRRHAPDGA